MRLGCELAIARTLPAAQPAELTFTLTNAGHDAVQVLVWQTPFEGFTAPIFTVTRDGAELDYRGPMLKRGAPRREDYLLLQPGERRQATVDLGEGWEVAAPGAYSVAYPANFSDVIAGADGAPRDPARFEAFETTCGTVEFMRAR